MKKGTAGSVPAGAGLALRSQLNYFDTQPCDVSITNSFVESIPPHFSLDNSSAPLEFIINSSQNLFTDLRNTNLLLRIKVVKNDGGALTTDKLSTVNLLLSSLFKECEIIVNGKTLTSESSDHYGLRSYMQAQFSFGENHKTTTLSAAGYYKDSGNAISITTNPGMKERSELIKQSKVVELCGNITCGYFNCTRYIPPNTQIILRLKKMNPEFVLLLETTTGTTPPTTSPYKIEFIYAQLLVQRHQVADPYASQIEKQLKTHKGYLNFKRLDLKTIHIPSNLYTAQTSNILIGTLPEKILVGLIPSTDLIGRISTNPYYFTSHSLESICVVVDTDSGVFRQEIKIDAEGKTTMDAYKSLNNLIANPETDGMSMAEYLDGNITFAFSILPPNLQAVSQMVRKGRVDLTLKFKNSVVSPLTAVILAQFDSTLMFTNDGEYTLMD